MSANAEILLEEKKNILMVPEAALITTKSERAPLRSLTPGRQRQEKT